MENSSLEALILDINAQLLYISELRTELEGELSQYSFPQTEVLNFMDSLVLRGFIPRGFRVPKRFKLSLSDKKLLKELISAERGVKITYRELAEIESDLKYKTQE